MNMSLPSMTEVEDREDRKLGLAVEAFRRRGDVRLLARGMSMLPSLWPGDLLMIRGVSQNEVTPGEIVLVLREKRFFIHRLVEMQTSEAEVRLVTRGDATPHDDPADSTELLGRVILVQRGNRSFVPSSRFSIFRSIAGWILCRSTHCRNLAMRFHAVRLRAFELITSPSSDSYAQMQPELDLTGPLHP